MTLLLSSTKNQHIKFVPYHLAFVVVYNSNMKVKYEFYKDRYININSVKTRYWKEGNTGSAVILLHGLGAYIESFSMLVKALAVNYTVDAFMKTLGIRKVNLVGWSMGGGIALQFVVDHPEMVNKMVLIDSGGLGRQFTVTLRMLTIPILGEILSRPGPKSCYRKFKYMVYDPNIIQSDWIDLECTMANIPGVQKTILKTLRSGATIFGGKNKIINPILPNLKSIKSKTLIIWGKNDRVIPLKYAYMAREKISDSSLYTLDKCGHAPPLEYPLKVNRRIFQFLKS